MLSTIISRNVIVVIINAIFTTFFDHNYEQRRDTTSYKRSFSIFTALRHRFLKKGNNVTSVFYILNKTAFSIKLIIFINIRLNLTCLDEGICFYINVFFYVHIFFSLSCLIYIHPYNLTLC